MITLILSFLPLYLSLCPSFTCKPSSLYLPQDTCSFYDPSRFTPVYYLNPCTNPLFPTCNFTNYQNSTCVPPLPTSPSRYPGEKCSKYTNCSSLFCKNDVCQGKAISNRCTQNLECGPGLVCSNYVCSSLKPISKACSSDSECEANSGCSSGFCTSYFSLAVGSLVFCNEFGENFLCETGKCEGSKCAAVKNSLYSPKLCRSNGDCPGSCDCGFNKNGNAYCRLEAGDSAYALYLSYMKEFLLSGRGRLCNTDRRFAWQCAADWWDLRKGLQIRDLGYYVHNYAKIVEFDDCSRSLFLSDYEVPEVIVLSYGRLLALWALLIIS